MKIFKASLDATAWFITISITIVFLFVLYLLILQWHVGGYGKYFGVILPPVIYFLAWVFRPVNYRITEDELNRSPAAPQCTYTLKKYCKR